MRVVLYVWFSYAPTCVYTFTSGCSQMSNVSSLVGTWVSDTGRCFNFTFNDYTSLVVPGAAFWPSPLTAFAPNMTSFAGNSPVASTCIMNISFTFTFARFLLQCANGEAFLGTLHFGVGGPATPTVNGNGGFGASFYVQSFIQNTTITNTSATTPYWLGTTAISSLQSSNVFMSPFLVPFTDPVTAITSNAVFAQNFYLVPYCGGMPLLL